MNNNQDNTAEQADQVSDETTKVLATVLHSLRNGISPIAVGLDLILNELNQVSTANLKRALAELEDPDTPPDRLETLTRYIFLASGKVADLVDSTKEQVKEQMGHLSDVEKILSKRHRPIPGQSPEGALKFYKMVDSALNLMAKELRSQVEIELAPDLDQFPPARAERFLLIKVLVNVLNNAAQSTLKANRSPGQILIRARLEDEKSPKMLHAEIEDNGCGLSEERAVEIFSNEGVETPSRLSPNGLRWSADAMRKMDGAIFIKSPGVGQGATLHLTLPVVNGDSAGNQDPRLKEAKVEHE